MSNAMPQATIIIIALVISLAIGATACLVVSLMRVPWSWEAVKEHKNALRFACEVVVRDAERLGDDAILREANVLLARSNVLHTNVVARIPRDAMRRELHRIDIETRLAVLEEDLDEYRSRLYLALRDTKTYIDWSD